MAMALKGPFWWRLLPKGMQQRLLTSLSPALTAPAATGFAGAKVNRLTLDWINQPQSADQEIKGDAQALRARGRELVRNNAYARRFVDLVAANVVGPYGIRLQAKLTGSDGLPVADANQRIEDAWEHWGEPANASADGRCSWREVQHLAVTAWAQDGEAFVRLLRGYRGSAFRFALQLLDPDLVDEQFNRDRSSTENEIRMGVEVDQFGRPLAYHVFTEHPAENRRERRRDRIPAEDIIHLYRPFRVGQTRGVTAFHPVLLDLRHLDGYQEAELTAARIAAAKMGFFVTTPEGAEMWQPPNNERLDRVQMEIEPGLLEQMPPGLDFRTWDPQHPVQAYGAFIKANLRAIAVGLGVSYHNLAGDLEAVNYSSARVGELSERDGWRTLQQWLIDHLHRRVFRAWLPFATASGELVLSSRTPKGEPPVEWQPRGWQWVDPQNEVAAAKEAIGLGLVSRTELAAQQGRDLEDVFAQLAAEQALAEEHGISVAGADVAGPSEDEDMDEMGETDDEEMDDEDEDE